MKEHLKVFSESLIHVPYSVRCCVIIHKGMYSGGAPIRITDLVLGFDFRSEKFKFLLQKEAESYHPENLSLD